MNPKHIYSTNAMKIKLYALLLCRSASAMTYSANGKDSENGDDYIIYSLADAPPRLWCGGGQRTTFRNMLPSFFAAIVEQGGRFFNIKILRDMTGDPTLRSNLERTLQKTPRRAPGIKNNQPQRTSIIIDANFMYPDMLSLERACSCHMLSTST